VLKENRKRYQLTGLLNRSDVSGTLLDDSLPANRAAKPNVDHKFPRAEGGSNSYSNAEVLARDENNAKSDIIVTPLAYPLPTPPAPSPPVVIVRKPKP